MIERAEREREAAEKQEREEGRADDLDVREPRRVARDLLGRERCRVETRVQREGRMLGRRRDFVERLHTRSGRTRVGSGCRGQRLGARDESPS